MQKSIKQITRRNKIKKIKWKDQLKIRIIYYPKNRKKQVKIFREMSVTAV